jgi:hypothetical protein
LLVLESIQESRMNGYPPPKGPGMCDPQVRICESEIAGYLSKHAILDREEILVTFIAAGPDRNAVETELARREVSKSRARGVFAPMATFRIWCRTDVVGPNQYLAVVTAVPDGREPTDCGSGIESESRPSASLEKAAQACAEMAAAMADRIRRRGDVAAAIEAV